MSATFMKMDFFAFLCITSHNFAKLCYSRSFAQFGKVLRGFEKFDKVLENVIKFYKV